MFYVLSCKIRVTESYWEKYLIDGDILALFKLSRVQLLQPCTDMNVSSSGRFEPINWLLPWTRRNVSSSRGERCFVFFRRQHDGFNHAASAVSILSNDGTAVFTLSIPTWYCRGTGIVTRSIPEYYSYCLWHWRR